MLVEIKPAITEDEYWSPVDKVTTGLDGYWDHDILILGVDPLPQLGDSYGRDWGDRYPSAGLLGEIFTERWEYTTGDHGRFVECEPYWGFGIGRWLKCIRCGKIGVFRGVEDAYTSHPCGHYFDSYAYLGAFDTRTIQGFWAQATNQVRWGGR
jgi:hypothetical protein